MQLSKKLKFVGYSLLLLGLIGVFSGAFDVFGYFAQQSILTSDPNGNTGELQESLIELNEKYPGWYPAWQLTNGILKVLVSIFFIVAGINLLKANNNALKLVYSSLSLSIIYVVVKAIIIVISGNALLMVQLFKMPLGMIIDFILLIIVVLGAKSFLEHEHREI